MMIVFIMHESIYYYERLMQGADDGGAQDA